MISEIFNPIESSLLLFFLIFLIAAYILFRVVTKALIFMLLGAMFPLFLKYVMHMDVVLSLRTMMYYSLLAGILYLLYLLFRAVVTVIRTGTFALKIVVLPFRITLSAVRSIIRMMKGRESEKSQRKKAGKKE